MYLTRLTLDPRSGEARRDLANAYELHRTLTRGFVTASDQNPPRFLWRLEASGSNWMSPKVLVQAAVPANWEPLRQLPNYLHSHSGVETKEIDPDQLVDNGALYRFRLVANPTVTQGGKRYGLSGEDKQLGWLQRQGERQGFQITSALVSADERPSIRRGQQRTITLRCVRFEGFLRVMDQALIKRALANGVGPAKAFGCGLLSLAKVQTAG